MTDNAENNLPPSIPLRPADVFMHLIVSFLAPMFLSVTGGDIIYARLAAIETVNAYRGNNHVDLLSIAQIVAFGLTTLSSLSLSMAENLSLSMTLRLRGNAAALNRAAEQCRRALRDGLQPELIPHHDAYPDLNGEEYLNEETVLANVARAADRVAEHEATLKSAAQNPQPLPAPVAVPAETPEQQRRAAWAAGMVLAAREVTADLAKLPPAERRAATIQAAAMTDAANDLMSGAPMSPPFPDLMDPSRHVTRAG